MKWLLIVLYAGMPVDIETFDTELECMTAALVVTDTLRGRVEKYPDTFCKPVRRP